MENIKEILKKYGIEIPADKVADFEKDVDANYKTINEEKCRGVSNFSVP